MTEEQKRRGPAATDVQSTGENVRQNVVRWRKARGWSTYELAGKLAAAGRAIPQSGVSRIESGARRVDVDDLTALAAVLGVSPVLLLLPPTGRGTVEVTGAGSVDARVAWLWVLGEEPLDIHKTRDAGERFEAAREFRRANHPHEPVVPIGQLLADSEQLSPVWAAAKEALADGGSMDAVHSYLNFREQAEQLRDARRSDQGDGDDVPRVD